MPKVDNMRDFTSKKLIENQTKSKISTVFDIANKKKINDIYKKLSNLIEADSITLQEMNE